MKRVSRQSGFSAIEIILVLALVSGLGALFITNFFRFQGTFSLRPAVEQMQRAVSAAHWHATTTRDLVHLSFLPEEALLRIHAADGALLETLPLPGGGEWALNFFRVKPEERFEAEPRFEIEDYPVRRIPVQPVGSPPFMVEIIGSQRQTNLYFDPFSAMTILIESEI